MEIQERGVGAMLIEVLIGFGLGLAGQGIRILIGLGKAKRPRVDAARWAVTLLIGGVAGALAALALPWGRRLEAGEIVALIAAGYAGADFVEGLLKNRLPGTKEE